MLDPRRIRSEPERIAELLRIKGFELDTALLNELDSMRKTLQQETEALQNERNSRSREIGQAKAAGKDIRPILGLMEDIKKDLDSKKEQLQQLQDQLHAYLINVPNIPDPAVPAGMTDEANQVVKTWGEIPSFDFALRDHTKIGAELHGLDFASASKLTGSRFVVMRGVVARLHRALEQFMLDLHTREHGYIEINVPYIVNRQSLHGTSQLPKFEEDLFRLQGDHDYYLIPTAEVPVTNLVRDEILDADALPLKYVCHTACFRSEAGNYGKDTRGMIRQHQFEKVELVQIVKPDTSGQTLKELTSHAERVLQLLELPYRKVILCGGDLGFGSALTYDLEVWLPSQECYREISSCSNFTDFQARRMQARWRNPDTGKVGLVHTLNGSGLAIGRTLIALMENFQDVDGRITIPAALRPYMDNLESIG